MMEALQSELFRLRLAVNEGLRDLEAWEIVLLTAGVTTVVSWVLGQFNQKVGEIWMFYRFLLVRGRKLYQLCLVLVYLVKNLAR